MRIWFDTARLTSLNLAPSDVIKAIQTQNVQASVGRIGARPVPESQQFQLNVQTQGRLVDPEQFGSIVLRANADGSTLRIKDVARVELGAMNDDNFSRLNGNLAVTIGIFLSPGSNAIATAAAVNATLDKVRARFPEGMKARATYDTTVFVNDTIHEVLKTLFEAFVLVALVVFLFLGQLRATIVPVIAVPVSIIGGFMVLAALGYSANTVSLLAMVLAIGIVVDDAIVVVENVERVMEEEPELSGRRCQESHDASDGTNHWHHAGVAVGLRSGRIHGRHFRHAVPAVRRDDHRNGPNLGTQRTHAVAGPVCVVPAPFRTASRRHGLHQSSNRRGADGYALIVRKLLRFSMLGVAIVVAFGLGVGGLTRVTPTSFLPEEDQGAFFVQVQLPDGVSVARTSEVVGQVEGILKAMPQVKDTVAIVGYSFLDFSHRATPLSWWRCCSRLRIVSRPRTWLRP